MIYALIGFLLVRLPSTIVSMIYANVPQCDDRSGLWSMQGVSACTGSDANLRGIVGLIAEILKWVNSFLALLCILLVLYAGWLIMISHGDEEKLKQAKRTIIYVLIGFIILIASHALFVFLIS